jgi:hypothetical protein
MMYGKLSPGAAIGPAFRPSFLAPRGENNACDFYAEPPIGLLISIFPGENGLPFATNQFLQLRLEPGCSNDCSLFIDFRGAL